MWCFRMWGLNIICKQKPSPISFRCEVPTHSVVEGQQTTMFKPQILKHHIPELPNGSSFLTLSIKLLPRVMMHRCGLSHSYLDPLKSTLKTLKQFLGQTSNNKDSKTKYRTQGPHGNKELLGRRPRRPSACRSAGWAAPCGR